MLLVCIGRFLPSQNKVKREKGAKNVAKRVMCMLLMLTALLALSAEAEEEKVIYLTFDDGPGPYTAQLLDILQEQNVKATFFLVNTGYHMETLLGRMVDEGHSVGIHSCCHDFKTIYANDDALWEDIYAMQSLIEEKCGEKTNLLRFPGGSSNTISRRYCPKIMSRAAARAEAEGFRYFDWNVDSGDAYGCQDGEMIYQKVICGIRGRKRAVVLQHDVNRCSVQTVERIICWGKNNGYVFRALTEDSPACRHRVQN